MALCPSRAVQEEEGCQLIVQPPFSLKGFLSSGTPFNSGSSPAMDSMYSFSSLPVLETCKEGRKETSRVGYGNKQSLQSCSVAHHLPPGPREPLGGGPRSCPWLWCAPSASSAGGGSVVPSPGGSHGFVVCAPSASSGCQGYSPFCTLGQYPPFASRSSPPSSADPVPFSTVPSLSYPEPFCPVTNRDGTCLKYSQASARAR